MLKKCFAISLVGLAAGLALLATVERRADGQTPTGVYADWTLAGASGAWTGTVGFPGTAMPSGTFASTSGAPTSLASGATTFLGAQTPFGMKYGSSVDKPYALLRQAGAGVPSVTTFTFAGPTPTSDWAFALGDIDADLVTVAAFGPGGVPVPTASLGWKSAFNYCQNTPKPAGCVGPGPFPDLPTWNPVTSTLMGSGPDTFGAAGWFEPTVPITTLTLTFAAQSGIPVYQVWMASMTTPPVTTTTTASTTTTTASTTTTTASTTTTTASTTTTMGPTTSGGPTTSAPTTPTSATPAGHHHTSAPKPRLADTGAESAVLAATGAGLLGLGVTLSRLARRRTAARSR